MKAFELKKSLELVQTGLGKKETLEQSTLIAFQQDRIFTFNDEVAVIVPFATGITGAIPAVPLYAFLNKLPSDAEIKVETKENELRFSSGKSRAGIRREEEIKLPVDEELPEPDEWLPLPDGFLKALDKTLFSCAKSGHQPILACIHVTESFMESCDGFRMTRIDCPSGQDALLDIKIAGANLAKLSNYFPIEFSFNGSWIQFHNKDNVRYCVRTVEGEYPNLDEFISIEGNIIDFPSELSEALDWCAIITDAKIKHEQEVDISIEKGKITVKGEGPDGWAEKSIRTKYDGDPISFQGNPTFLKEMVGLARQVTVGNSALKIESEGFVHVVSLNEKE